MKLRTLLLAFTLFGSACALPPVPQFPCKTPGSTSECDNGQVCGIDLVCTSALATCPSGTKRCAKNGVCTDVATTLNCGGCAVDDPKFACAAGDQCVAAS